MFESKAVHRMAHCLRSVESVYSIIYYFFADASNIRQENSSRKSVRMENILSGKSVKTRRHERTGTMSPPLLTWTLSNKEIILLSDRKMPESFDGNCSLYPLPL